MTVDALHPDHRVLVAIDGPDAAGKSTLARKVAELLVRPVVNASIDNWHLPRAARVTHGPESPLGYYADSFDHAALVRELLERFRDGTKTVTTSWFDHLTDQPRRVDVSGVHPTA